MILFAELALSTRLTTLLNDRHHLSYTKIAKQVGLVVVRLLIDARRSEGVLEYHGDQVINNDYKMIKY